MISEVESRPRPVSIATTILDRRRKAEPYRESLIIRKHDNTIVCRIFYSSVTGNIVISGYNAGLWIRSSSGIAYLGSADGSGIIVHAGDPQPSDPTGENLELTSDDDVVITPGSGSFRTKVTRMDTSASVVTGSRAVDTIYQNTSGKPLYVMVTLDIGDDLAAQARIGSSSPPGTLIGSCGYIVGAGSPYQTLNFIVPVNYYYRVLVDAGVNLQCWTETEIG